MMGSSDPLMGEAADTNELNAYLTGEEPRDLGNGDFVGIGESGRITTDTGEETPNRVRGMAQRYAQSLQGGARSLPDIVSDSSKPVDKRRPVDRARVQELRPPFAGRNSALGPPPEISMKMVIFILIPVLVGLVAYTTSPGAFFLGFIFFRGGRRGSFFCFFRIPIHFHYSTIFYICTRFYRPIYPH